MQLELPCSVWGSVVCLVKDPVCRRPDHGALLLPSPPGKSSGSLRAAWRLCGSVLRNRSPGLCSKLGEQEQGPLGSSSCLCCHMAAAGYVCLSPKL